MEEIHGYKAFNKNKTNRYEIEYIEGEVYHVDGPLRFGNDGHGFHFCKRLEDTLRYFDAMNDEIAIAEVTSLTEVEENYDDYNGYYDMYAARDLRIDRFLERKEIIDMFLEMPVSFFDSSRLERFLSQFKLTNDELVLFKKKCQGISKLEKTIAWYQENDKDAFNLNNNPKVKTYNNS